MDLAAINSSTYIKPSLSAVICTYNRASLLAQLLDNLSKQTLPARYFEIVVIDDGSVDDTKSVVDAYSSKLPISYAYQINGGIASARNYGISICRGDVILFMDDDNTPSEALFEEHLKTHRQFSAQNYAVLGHVALSADICNDPLMHFVTEIGQFLLAYPSLKHNDILDYTYFWGGACSAKRSFLLEHGTFDPVFRFGCEDIELGYRLSKHGLGVIFNKNALSYMSRKIDFDAFCHRLKLQGASGYVFSQLHPEQAIQRWTEVKDSEQNWAIAVGHHEAIINAARSLDLMANRKVAAGFDLTDRERDLLYQTYWAAFKISKAIGFMEKKNGRLQPLEQQLSAIE